MTTNAFATMGKPCFYCGLPASTIDHTTPQTIQDRLAVAPGMPLPHRETVPACRECNCLLGARVFPTLAARRAAIHERLTQRYASVLGAPEWTPDDLAQLGPTLRTYIETQQKLRTLIRRRLRWPND